MNQRPPYRWKSFWIGLFLLGFLIWAWSDARKNESHVTFATPSTVWKIVRLGGSTTFVAGDPAFINSPPGWSFYRQDKPPSLENRIRRWKATRQADVRHLTIPDIFIILPSFTRIAHLDLLAHVALIAIGDEIPPTPITMIPTRPIYRWKSLWLGVFVLGFLSWAWWESYRQPYHITRFQAPRYYQIFHAQGEIVFRHGKGTTTTDWWIAKLPPTSPSMSEAKTKWDRDGSAYVAIPYTAIMAASVLGLAGFVVWRTRRWNRLAADTTQTP